MSGKRGATGTAGAYEHGLPYLDNALYRMAKHLPPTERVKPKEKKPTGKTTIPDDVVLEIRRKAEIERLPFKQIQQQYPQFSVRWLRQVIDYELRANLRLPQTK